MSYVSGRMDEIKKILMGRDRENAINALMEHIHYRVAPQIQNIIPVTVFECRADIKAFCEERQIALHAFEWVLKELRGSRLLEQTEAPVALSRTGVERYCGN